MGMELSPTAPNRAGGTDFHQTVVFLKAYIFFQWKHEMHLLLTKRKYFLKIKSPNILRRDCFGIELLVF